MIIIHKLIQKLAFGCVSLAANFWSSLAPCYSAMVTRSRRKNLRRFLAKNQLLNQFVYIRKSSLYGMKIYGAIIASLMIPMHAAADSAAIIGGIDLTGTGP